MTQDKKYLLTITQFAQYEKCNSRTIKRRISAKSLQVIKVKSPKGHGKNGFENRIHYTQLSPLAQEAFLKDSGLLDPPKLEPQPVEEPKIYNLKPYQKEEADRRERIVKEWQEVRKDVPQGKMTAFKKTFALGHNIHRRCLERWIKAYATGGYYSLVPNYNNGDQEGFLTKNKELAKFLDEIFMRPYGPSRKAAHEQICKRCVDLNLKPPSYRTVVDFINKKWTKAQQLLIRNKQEWDRLFSPYVRRDWEKVAINEVLIGDGKQIDVACEYKGSVIFPWITTWCDARSRKFVGWILWPTHNSWTIAQSFVYAVRQFGVPKTVYVDRGKDYKSIMVAGTKIKEGPTIKLLEGVEKTIIPGILRDLGTEIFFAAPYNAREKIIEPNFKIFTHRLSHLPGYRGHNIKTRPKKLANEIKTGKLMTFDELSKEIDQVIEARNARPHSTTGVSPDSYYENFTPIIPSQELLDYLLMDVHLKKVKDSTVTIEGLVYRGEELFRLAGEEVEVRRDPKDITRAVIIYKGKVFGSVYLELADHFQSPITLDSVKTAQRIRKRTKKWRKLVIENQDFIDDPLRMAVELDSEGTPRQRDIRPADSKVVGINKKSRLAKDVKKALREEERQREERKTAAGGDSLISQLLSSFEREAPVEEEPRYRLVDLDIDD